MTGFIFLGSKITAFGDCSYEIKILAPWKKSYNNPRQHIKKQRLDFADKSPYCKTMVFPVVIYECEIWNIKKAEHLWCFWYFWIVVLEKTPKSPLDSKEIEPVNPKENQPWIFSGRTDAEAEAPVIWPSNGKSQLIGKGLDAGKDWEQEEKGMTDHKMVWMASPTWAWVWSSSGSWWWTGKPGMLKSTGSQKSQTRLNDWTELNW